MPDDDIESPPIFRSIRASYGYGRDFARSSPWRLDQLDQAILLTIFLSCLTRSTIKAHSARRADARRAISVSALSRSLDLPYETARRRCKALCANGLCRQDASGISISRRARRLASDRGFLAITYDNTQSLYRRLIEAGGLQAPTGDFIGGAPCAQAVAKGAAEYVLRLVEAIVAEFGDVLDGLIWLEVLGSSHEHLPYFVGLDVSQSRPVRLATISKRVAAPAETVRRRVAALAARGLFQMQEGGVRLSADTAARPDILNFCRRNARDLRLLFASLERLGVIDRRRQPIEEQDRSPGLARATRPAVQPASRSPTRAMISAPSWRSAT